MIKTETKINSANGKMKQKLHSSGKHLLYIIIGNKLSAFSRLSLT